ncbi:MAG: putative transcriptional regulator [Frankiales bacterium]|nr:putative transcriptional regulator [Frankiales bacterium]
MTAASRARFAELVRSDPVDVGLACLLVGCESEPDLDLDASLAVLDTLAATARPLVSRLGPAEGLRVALGERAGFAGSAADYDDVRSSLLHEVLRRGRGLPILLSVVWCEVAARLDLVAVPLGLPGHVLVCVGDPLDEHVVVDPFHGGRLAEAPSEPVLQPVDLLLRLLTNVRALTARHARSLETARTQLWATELSLLLPHHPVGLRRERGELLVRLGDHAGGARELEEYASLVDPIDDTEAEVARRHARSARARLN